MSQGWRDAFCMPLVFYLGFAEKRTPKCPRSLHCSFFSKEHKINNGAHPSTAKLVPIQSSQGIRSKQEVPWGEEGGRRKREVVKPSHALMWDFPQHSSPVVSYSSARHLRREERNKPCSSGYHSIDYIFFHGLFPFFIFSYQVSHSIYPDQCKKGQNPCLAALEMLQLVLKLMLFQHRFLLLCS